MKNINLKVKDYLDKNRLLLKSFFSLKSIKLLHQRFQESRLLYGIAVFIDIPLVVKILNNINSYLSIFDKLYIIDNSKVGAFGGNRLDQKLISMKNLEINKNKNVQNNNNNNNNSTLNNNKSYLSSLNFFNELDKDNIIKSENKLEILNNKNQNYINTNDNNVEVKKDNNIVNKCIVF